LPEFIRVETITVSDPTIMFDKSQINKPEMILHLTWESMNCVNVSGPLFLNLFASETYAQILFLQKRCKLIGYCMAFSPSTCIFSVRTEFAYTFFLRMNSRIGAQVYNHAEQTTLSKWQNAIACSYPMT